MPEKPSQGEQTLHSTEQIGAPKFSAPSELGKALGSKNYLVDKTRVVLIWRAIGVLSGFVLDAAILAYFGLGNQTDAFFAALAIPFLIDATLSVQFTQVIVPMLADVRQQSGESGASSYLSNVITIWLLLVSGLAVLGMAASRLIMPLQVPGWAAPAVAMAVKMNLILVWMIPLCGLAALLGGALYARHRYWLSSSTKAMNNLGILAVAVLGFQSLGIYALAWGYIAGAAVQCLVLWIALARDGFHYRPRYAPQDPMLRATARLVLYPLAGQMLGELRTLLENFCASFYAPGVLSALRYASRIIMALSSVLMSSVVTAVAPTVAHFIAGKRMDDMKKTVRSGIKLLLFMSVPVCVWLVFDGNKLIPILFERGKFSHSDSALTSQLIALMTPYIFFSRAITIVQTPFYAVKDTRSLVISMVWGFVLYLIVIPPALYWMGIYGFPLATFLAPALNTVVISFLAHRSFGPMGWVRLRGFFARLAAAVAVGCVGFAIGNFLSTDLALPGLAGKCVAAAIPSVLGFAGFGFGALALQLVDPGELLRQVPLTGFLRLRRLFPSRVSITEKPD